jgi:hypothetical protein
MKNSVSELKAGRTRALTVGLLLLPPSVKIPTPAHVIVIDGVGVSITNQPLGMEK